MKEVRAIIDRQWTDREDNDHEVDVLTGHWSGSVFRMSAVPAGVREEAYKLNNLFARVTEIRRIALLRRLKSALQTLLGGEPLICNSLSFERRSQQEFHIDSWYMPPPVENRMVAASIALDDVNGENGPIRYYPGSHNIPPYFFSNGQLNEVPAEAPVCKAYLEVEIARRGLKPGEMRAKAGDIFLWHGQLLHGGGEIRDFSRTRASLVVHYWRSQDLPPNHVRRDRYGAYLGHTLRGEISY